MTAWEAIKALFGNIGTVLWAILKTWKWSINLILIAIILITNTIAGAQTGEYWHAYRDGIIKDVFAADKVIYDNIEELKTNDWQLEGLRTEGHFQWWHNFWVKWDAFNFIIVEFWFIFMCGYVIWWLLAGDWMFAPIAHENGKAAWIMILIMAVLFSFTNLTYLFQQTAVTGKEVWSALWPPFPGVTSLFSNFGNIIQTI